MAKKVLFISNTANFSKFNLPFMKWFSEQNWKVDYCSPDDEIIMQCDNHFILDIPRNPTSVKTFTCINKLKKKLNSEQYDIIHCHTPMGAVIARIAAIKLWKKKTIKVIYTAHGFHFYKGAPKLNWLIYYPVEKFLSRFTDIIITINEEDYNIAKTKFKMKHIYKIDGVGVNLTKFSPIIDASKKIKLRNLKKINQNAFVLLYTAEFIDRKNHNLLFEILPELMNLIPEIQLILAGKGELFEKCKRYTKDHNLESIITFTGYTTEINEYCKIADILVSTSKQEGQGINLIEGMATGLPIICSNIRGHKDVVEQGINGFLCDLTDPNQFIDSIVKLYKDKDLYRRVSMNNINKAAIFSVEESVNKMASIYKTLF